MTEALAVRACRPHAQARHQNQAVLCPARGCGGWSDQRGWTDIDDSRQKFVDAADDHEVQQRAAR